MRAFLRRIPRSAWLLLGVMLVIIIPFFCFEDAINAWMTTTVDHAQGRRGTLALLFFTALAVDIFLPIPSSLISTLCGMTLGLNLGFWTSFMGMNVSCVAGYLLGHFCAGAAERLIGTVEMATLQRIEHRCGGLLLIALRGVPVLAEASVLFAGIVRTPPIKSALWMLIGNAVVSFAYALAGHFGHDSGAMYPALLASLLVTGAIMLGGRYLTRHRPIDSDNSDIIPQDHA